MQILTENVQGFLTIVSIRVTDKQKTEVNNSGIEWVSGSNIDRAWIVLQMFRVLLFYGCMKINIRTEKS